MTTATKSKAQVDRERAARKRYNEKQKRQASKDVEILSRAAAASPEAQKRVAPVVDSQEVARLRAEIDRLTVQNADLAAIIERLQADNAEVSANLSRAAGLLTNFYTSCGSLAQSGEMAKFVDPAAWARDAEHWRQYVKEEVIE
jgi:hypothetical protein